MSRNEGVWLSNGWVKVLPWIFYGCKTLTNIDIPQSVTTIKKGAFYGCKSLPTYMIFDIIQRFGKEAFDS